MSFPAGKLTNFLQNVVLEGHIAKNRRKREGFMAQESKVLAYFHETIGST